MLAALVVLLRTLGLLCGGPRAVALENVALGQQLPVLRRTVRRPQLRKSGDCFGSCSPRRGRIGERVGRQNLIANAAGRFSDRLDEDGGRHCLRTFAILLLSVVLKRIREEKPAQPSGSEPYTSSVKLCGIRIALSR
jgi:hypothetical protein